MFLTSSPTLWNNFTSQSRKIHHNFRQPCTKAFSQKHKYREGVWEIQNLDTGPVASVISGSSVIKLYYISETNGQHTGTYVYLTSWMIWYIILFKNGYFKRLFLRHNKIRERHFIASLSLSVRHRPKNGVNIGPGLSLYHL